MLTTTDLPPGWWAMLNTVCLSGHFVSHAVYHREKSVHVGRSGNKRLVTQESLVTRPPLSSQQATDTSKISS